jgi:hypothetical protein
VTVRTVAWVDGIGKLTKQELVALLHASDRIGTDVSNLASCIGFETGKTFSPSILNRAGSGAVGEIQFMPNTARSLGTTTAELAAMTFIAQLEYVVKYFSWFKGKDLNSVEALYSAIFWPAMIDKTNDYVVTISTALGKVYRQNAGFDVNHDGTITRGEICAAIRKYRATADGNPMIEIPEPDDVFLSDVEKREFANLVMRTSEEATEDFRAGSPLPDDDEPPPTVPTA